MKQLDITENQFLDFSENILQDADLIIESAQRTAYRAADTILVQRNWLLGKRIALEELRGENRAEYGKQVVRNLAKHLTEKYGKGFDTSNLYKFTQFAEFFPNLFILCESEILDTACLKSPQSEDKILDTLRLKSQDASPQKVYYSLCKQFYKYLTWSHFRTLLQVPDAEAREWYAEEAAREGWSVRTLQRNISSQYYYRALKSHDKKAVHDEMVQITSPLQDKLEFIKSPVIAEFLGLAENASYRESTLQKAILDNLQHFMMELGKGFAFVGRQQRVHTEKRDYYIDLVFYNIYLKCYVLIDLKTSTVTHQDVGQMDMYVRMYDELKRIEGDNPTLGILLCSDTDDDIARYSILKGSEQLFATKYMLYMPTQEQLREEIERQKLFFELQQQELPHADD